MRIKLILTLTIALLVLVLLVAPAIAAPTNNEQKVPVTLKFTPVSGTSVPGDRWVTNGGVTQVRDAGLTYAIELTIDGAQPITIMGQSVAERNAMGKRPEMVLYHEYHVMSFPTKEGGFEGNTVLIITDLKSATEFTLQAHGVFQGTGAFEGQTLNLWRYKGPANEVWEGYLLKA